jgi:conjugal transfer/entry exclusion protein
LVETRYRELRNPAEARRYAERVVQMTNGGNARILRLLAKAFEQMGDLRQAADADMKALAMLPADESNARREMEEELRRFRATPSPSQ